MKYIANLSMGKDSLAMVLLLLRKNYPLDEVIFFNTGIEFNCIEKMANRIGTILKGKSIKFTVLKSEKPFLFHMLERPVQKNDGSMQQGYKWCGGACRWGTTIKLQAIKKHYQETYGSEAIVEYVGIAADEKHRINRERNGEIVKLYPLIEWDLTEKDCLEYCYQEGYLWEENGIRLYDILDRVSCKYCRNKNLKELYNIYIYLPDVWEDLKELQRKIDIPFKQGKTIFDLEEIFYWRTRQLSLDDIIHSSVSP